ncbi:MAG: hypothetical protein GY864_01250 [Desulfobacterales bacterium]|nr:hypothetical protein [Desulfobacterales bacterium]
MGSSPAGKGVSPIGLTGILHCRSKNPDFEMGKMGLLTIPLKMPGGTGIHTLEHFEY